MKSSRLLLLAAIVIAGLQFTDKPTLAAPYAWFEIDGNRTDIALNTHLYPDGTVNFYGRDLVVSNNSYWLGLDIWIFPTGGTASATNLVNYSSNPLTFALSLGGPCNIPAVPTEVYGRSFLVLYDQDSNGAATVTPTGLKLQSSNANGTDLGVAVGDTFSGVNLVDEHIVGPKAGPDGPWTFFSTDVNFSLSSGDYANISNTAWIQPVPVPAPLFFLAPGLLGLAAARRKLKK